MSTKSHCVSWGTWANLLCLVLLAALDFYWSQSSPHTVFHSCSSRGHSKLRGGVPSSQCPHSTPPPCDTTTAAKKTTPLPTLTLVSTGRGVGDVNGPLDLHLDPSTSSCAAPTLHLDTHLSCLAGQHLLFIGDSTMRFQYMNLISRLELGDWVVGSPPLERDSEAWGGNSWESYFKATTATIPHICDCARCPGSQLFEEGSAWHINGTTMLCAMENRHYFHPPTGTRVTFVLAFGTHPIAWNSPSFLGLDGCLGGRGRRGGNHSACPQQGCAPGECYPPSHAFPFLTALPQLLTTLRPDTVVLSSGAWGGYEEESVLGPVVEALKGYERSAKAEAEAAAAAAAAAAVPDRSSTSLHHPRRTPTFWWKTPSPSRPGASPEWSSFTWDTPAAVGAFKGAGWGVIDTALLVSSLLPFADLRSHSMPCTQCASAALGREEFAPHWGCVFCALRGGDDAGGGGEGEEGRAAIIKSLGGEGLSVEWPWKGGKSYAGGAAGSPFHTHPSTGSLLNKIPVDALWDDWIHLSPWMNRLVNEHTLVHLCASPQ